MSNITDINVLRAMSNIAASEDGKMYIGYLKELFNAKAGTIAIVREDTQLRWTQGSLQRIGDSIKELETADESIRSLRNKN